MTRKLLALLLCLVMLVLCGCTASSERDRDDDDHRASNHRNDRDDDESEDKDDEDSGQDAPWGDKDDADAEDPAPSLVDTVTYQHFYNWDAGKEHAIITAFDKEGNVVWELATVTYAISQMDQIAWVGEHNNRVYYVEAGAVIALDRETGAQVWKNEAFGGVPTTLEDACLIAPDGTLYLTGYFGPDLMVIAPNGSTVYRADSVHPDYYWPYGLELDGNRLTIILEGGPQGSDRYTVTLDTTTWEVIE